MDNRNYKDYIMVFIKSTGVKHIGPSWLIYTKENNIFGFN